MQIKENEKYSKPLGQMGFQSDVKKTTTTC